MDELWDQTKGIFVNDAPTPNKFPKQIAFNVIPHIDVFMEDGYTKEEWKVLAETKKMLDPKIKVTCTAVRVPVFVGHSEAVNMEFANARFRPTRPAKPCATRPGSWSSTSARPVATSPRSKPRAKMRPIVSRIREDNTVENGLAMWVVSDNLRKGAALNTIQIAETLIERGLIREEGCCMMRWAALFTDKIEGRPISALRTQRPIRPICANTRARSFWRAPCAASRAARPRAGCGSLRRTPRQEVEQIIAKDPFQVHGSAGHDRHLCLGHCAGIRGRGNRAALIFGSKAPSPAASRRPFPQRER